MNRSKKVLEPQDYMGSFARKVFGRSLNISLVTKTCVSCGSNVRECEFRDETSRKEYAISGMCQTCQDSMSE